MKTVAILTGGESSEREVAQWSAQYVQEAIGTRANMRVFDLPSELDAFVRLRATFDAVIPVLHGRGGEDGAIQGFLKTLGVPFLFSDVAAHAVGMDKRLGKLVANSVGVETPEATVITREAKQFPQEIISSVSDLLAMTGSVVVKPVDGGSTIGVSIVRTENDLGPALEKAFDLSATAIVETCVSGREFTVGVIDDNGVVTGLPVIEIVSKDGFFDFESKYVDGKMASEVCPAQIDDALRDALQQAAVQVHAAIGARHASRSDFIVDAEGTPWFLEINTIPGMTKNSLLPKAVRESGRDFGALLLDWVEDVIAPPAHVLPNQAAPRL